jgi:hypothetical protein
MPVIVKSSDSGSWAGTRLSDGRIALDRRLAREHGYNLPYIVGPNAGDCPGTASYGHGFSYTAIHGGTCCQRWDEMHQDTPAELGGPP